MRYSLILETNSKIVQQQQHLHLNSRFQAEIPNNLWRLIMKNELPYEILKLNLVEIQQKVLIHESVRKEKLEFWKFPRCASSCFIVIQQESFSCLAILFAVYKGGTFLPTSCLTWNNNKIIAISISRRKTKLQFRAMHKLFIISPSAPSRPQTASRLLSIDINREHRAHERN